MKLTPLDIRHKEFKRGMRGYADVEVDEFLDEVADEYERLFKENIDLSERVESLVDVKQFGVVRTGRRDLARQDIRAGAQEPASVTHGLAAARAVDQNAAHRLGRGSKKVERRK